MAAAPPYLADGRQGPGEDEVPPGFRRALADLHAALDGALPRPEVLLTPIPAPRRLAPFAHALEAVVAVDGEQLADGRFVLLHDPAGQDAWQGAFRVVTYAHAEVEPEIATDPLLPEVTWSWLTGALAARAVAYLRPSGTVTRAHSHFFGELGERPAQSRLELRASWTPGPVAPPPRSPAAAEESPPLTGLEMGRHLGAWCDLLCQCAGLPPQEPDGTAPGDADGAGPGAGQVVPLPKRRGPQPS